MPPNGAPAPILATWAPPNVTVQFSAALTPGPLNVGNWFARVANLSLNIFNATALAPDLVRLQTLGGGADPGPDVVSYSPPPFDVTGPTGDAPAFADFPIT